MFWIWGIFAILLYFLAALRLLEKYAFIFWYLLLKFIHPFVLKILILLIWMVCSAIPTLILRHKGLNVSSLNIIILILFFSYRISSVLCGPTVEHIDRLFCSWLKSLAHVWVAQLLELHGWFFLQTLSHPSYSFVHLHLPAFCVVMRWNIWVICVSVAALSENRVLSVDLRSILSVHLGIVYELLSRIADPAS